MAFTHALSFDSRSSVYIRVIQVYAVVSLVVHYEATECNYFPLVLASFLLRLITVLILQKSQGLCRFQIDHSVDSTEAESLTEKHQLHLTYARCTHPVCKQWVILNT